jgi:hypothetical protein
MRWTAGQLTQDECAIVQKAMQHSNMFASCTLWMSKKHTATLHHFITFYNDMFHHINDIMCALAENKAQR